MKELVYLCLDYLIIYLVDPLIIQNIKINIPIYDENMSIASISCLLLLHKQLINLLEIIVKQLKFIFYFLLFFDQGVYTFEGPKKI